VTARRESANRRPRLSLRPAASRQHGSGEVNEAAKRMKMIRQSWRGQDGSDLDMPTVFW
jgi:hypothetical protein